MKRFQFINQNIVFIKEGIRHGLYPTCLLGHWVVYCRFDYYRKLGYPVTKAALCTAEDMKVSKQTVFNIKKDMENENN